MRTSIANGASRPAPTQINSSRGAALLVHEEVVAAIEEFLAEHAPVAG